MEYLFTFIIFSLLMLALSLGLLFGRDAAQTCNGSLNKQDCSGCNTPCKNRKKRLASKGADDD